MMEGDEVPAGIHIQALVKCKCYNCTVVNPTLNVHRKTRL